MSIFWQNSNNLAKKCSTTPAGPVHSSPATQLDASEEIRKSKSSFGTRTYVVEVISAK